ncbi:MAG: apolipoprotein N-acyltransferase [Deltaproteobacteria bacterium]|nr:apolipoprotein N-acyltransferase [Deltaproteobacteria bacterium]
MMPVPRPSPVSLRNLLLAALSGVLLTLSFPPGKFSFVAWFALVPLLKGIQGTSPFNAFKLGLVSGLAHFLTLIYWIIVVLEHYGNLHIVIALIALILLSLYLSLYMALFSTLASRLTDTVLYSVILGGYWVGLEYLQTHLMTGFPWCLLGYSQYEHLHIIQLADLFGVYGISFLIVCVNGLIFRISLRPPRRNGRVLKWELPVSVLLLAGAWVYGLYQLSEARTGEEGGRPVKAAVVQANIDQSVKWDPAYQEETLQRYYRLTRATRSFHPELIVWPETSLPFFFQDHPKFSPGIVSLAEESGAVLIFGSPAYRRDKRAVRYYNRAYMIAPESGDILYYDKIHLVPFGEYVPLKRYLPFIHRLVAAAGDFARGEKSEALKTGDLSVGVLICFEAIFPQLAGELTRNGANILVNITNDAWFGMTSAPFQHLSMAVFRAVENRRPMIRAANTGFSALITPTGVIQSKSDLFVEAVLKDSITAGAFPLTFYSRFGDLFAVTLLIISAAHIIYHIRTRRRRKAG